MRVAIRRARLDRRSEQGRGLVRRDHLFVHLCPRIEQLMQVAADLRRVEAINDLTQSVFFDSETIVRVVQQSSQASVIEFTSNRITWRAVLAEIRRN